MPEFSHPQCMGLRTSSRTSCLYEPHISNGSIAVRSSLSSSDDFSSGPPHKLDSSDPDINHMLQDHYVEHKEALHSLYHEQKANLLKQDAERKKDSRRHILG